MRQFLATLIAIAFVASIGNTANAHTEFKKELIKKYDLKKVSCTACHDKKDKKIRNKFGKAFDKLFEGKDLSAKYKAAKKKAETRKMPSRKR